jgi:hypothetical protein
LSEGVDNPYNRKKQCERLRTKGKTKRLISLASAAIGNIGTIFASLRLDLGGGGKP